MVQEWFMVQRELWPPSLPTLAHAPCALSLVPCPLPPPTTTHQPPTAPHSQTIGFTNQAEVARVLDIAMNENSLFLSYGDGRRTKNASVSRGISHGAAKWQTETVGPMLGVGG